MSRQNINRILSDSGLRLPIFTKIVNKLKGIKAIFASIKLKSGQTKESDNIFRNELVPKCKS